MKKKGRGIMKKLLCIALTVVMALTTLAACNSSANVSSSASASASVQAEPLEITWVVYNQIGITPDNDSTVKKLIEEKFNVKLTIPQVDIHTAEQWNLYWASGNTPDCAFMNNTSSAVFKLADQGLVRSIPEGYLDTYMPEYLESLYTIVPEEIVKTQIKYKDEEYIVPFANYTGNKPYVTAIRKDWMDAVGVTELPTTPDEMFELAKLFTFNDPDKNGANDTYGLHGGSKTRRYMRFGYVHTYFNVWPDIFSSQDGKIVYTSLTDPYLEQLKLLNTWYEAGVIDPEFATDDRDIQRKKWAEGKFGIIFDHPSWFSLSNPGNIVTSLVASNPKAEIVYTEPFVDKAGNQSSVAWFPTTADTGSMFFGINCTDEKIAKIMEIRNSFIADWEWYMRCDYGVEGTDYTYNADGIIETVAASRTPEYMSEQGLYAFTLSPLTGDIEKKYKLTKSDAELYAMTEDWKKMYVYTDFNFPGLNESLTLYKADIESISDEFFYNTIMGKVDIDTGFAAFKKALEDAGVQKVIDEYQAGIDQ